MEKDNKDEVSDAHLKQSLHERLLGMQKGFHSRYRELLPVPDLLQALNQAIADSKFHYLKDNFRNWSLKELLTAKELLVDDLSIGPSAGTHGPAPEAKSSLPETLLHSEGSDRGSTDASACVASGVSGVEGARPVVSQDVRPSQGVDSGLASDVSSEKRISRRKRGEQRT